MTIILLIYCTYSYIEIDNNFLQVYKSSIYFSIFNTIIHYSCTINEQNDCHLTFVIISLNELERDAEEFIAS